MRQSDDGRVRVEPITWERPARTRAAHAEGLGPAPPVQRRRGFALAALVSLELTVPMESPRRSGVAS